MSIKKKNNIGKNYKNKFLADFYFILFFFFKFFSNSEKFENIIPDSEGR